MAQNWVEPEISECDFGDVRLNRRLGKMLQALGERPGDSLPTAFQDWANTKAAYRFFDNDAVSEDKILAGHFRSTAQRIHATDGPILILQDTTDFAFKRANPEKIGFTGTATGPRQRGEWRKKYLVCGMLMHLSLAITPEGLPMAYEVMPGNIQDRQTLVTFLKKIRRRFGKARRTWIMDRGIPTEETLALMRRRRHRISYLVGTPKGRLSTLEKRLVDRPWHRAREKVTVKLVDERDEVFVWVESADRVSKERAMRRRRMKELLKRLKELKGQAGLGRDDLLVKLGQAKQKAGRAYGLVKVVVGKEGEGWSYGIDRARLRMVWRREGRYLLRTNLTADDPAQLWEMYLRLVEVEAAFRDLKGDLGLRPIYHSKESRVEAHVFVAFMAYCLHVCLRGHRRGGRDHLVRAPREAVDPGRRRCGRVRRAVGPHVRAPRELGERRAARPAVARCDAGEPAVVERQVPDRSRVPAGHPRATRIPARPRARHRPRIRRSLHGLDRRDRLRPRQRRA